MARRRSRASWPLSLSKTFGKIARQSIAASTKAATRALRRSINETLKRKPAGVFRARPAVPRLQAAGSRGKPGRFIHGVALGAGGPRSYRLYEPPAAGAAARLPLLVMLHGCSQDAAGFAASTRMNAIAARESFYVLYPEQDRLAHPHGCWNWFETRSGRAYGEVATILAAIDQVCALYPIDADKVAIAGLSAGASLAALAAFRHPTRFQAVVMHSGVAPGLAHSTLTALSAMRGRRSIASMLAASADATHTSPDSASWPRMLVIQGSSDAVVDPRNGLVAAEFWASLTRARQGVPRRVQRGQRRPSVITDFSAAGRKMVTLCEVEGLAHGWSGGDGRLAFGDNHGPDASRMVWAFSRQQFDAQTLSFVPGRP